MYKWKWKNDNPTEQVCHSDKNGDKVCPHCFLARFDKKECSIIGSKKFLKDYAKQDEMKIYLRTKDNI